MPTSEAIKSTLCTVTGEEPDADFDAWESKTFACSLSDVELDVVNHVRGIGTLNKSQC